MTEQLQCPECKRVGCWMEDEEDKDFILCKCGESREKLT